MPDNGQDNRAGSKLTLLFYLGALFLPLVFYVIPLANRYAWSALGPNPPGLSGQQFNSLNPPEGYRGRVPDQPITIEPWGASVINVPYNARIKQYLLSGSLPLWNPYQGIGQPFAAQGEGSPYFPLAIFRALIPYSKANYVTFLGFYIAAVFLFLFLRELGLSDPGAFFGGVAYMLSGALSLFAARPNIADQLCVVPILFWAGTKAVRERKLIWYAELSAAVAICILAGFIQVAILSLLAAGIFNLVYAGWLYSREKQFWKVAAIVTGAMILGIGLAAFHMLPIAEAIRVSFSKDPEHLASIPIPYANVLAFFFPSVWGQYFESWLPGHYPDVVDWNNLFAYAGTGILLLSIAGFSISEWQHRVHHNLFLFFSLGGVFLLLRYVSFPLISWVNLLPIISRQSPKHANGLTVFFFVIAAAIAVEYVRSWNLTRLKWLLIGLMIAIVSSIIILIELRGGFSVIAPKQALQHLTITIIILFITNLILWLATRWAQHSSAETQFAFVIMVVAELALYIPLGNSSTSFLYARLGISALVLVGGVLCVRGRYVVGVLLGVTALVLYATMIIQPARGLPRQFDLDQPPQFMLWLEKHTGSDYRTFGIQPETSSIAGIQDIGAVGPFGLQEYDSFVRMVSQNDTLDTYERTTVFSLAGYMNFDLQQYQRAKSIFDWIGVKYLILDRGYFKPRKRTDDIALQSLRDMQIAYHDDRVKILESLSAQPKVVFYSTFRIFPNEQVIIRSLKNNPDQINGPPMLELTAGDEMLRYLPRNGFTSLPLTPDIYAPNKIQIIFNASTPGLVVVKDGFYPGWRATIDGNPVDILRVNGMVRGILIAQPGQHVIEMVYRPKGFVIGVWLMVAVILLYGNAIGYERITHKTEIPFWLILPGIFLVLVILFFGMRIYYVG